MIKLRNNKKTLDVYGESVLRWAHEGRVYCLYVECDDFPDDPRNDCDNITTMACFYPRHSLGDEVDEKDPEGFWRQLVRNHVSDGEILAAIESGKLNGIRIAPNSETPDLVDVYEIYAIWTPVGKSEPKEHLEYEGIPKDSLTEYLVDDLTIRHCMTLMKPYAEWLPLYVYEHSGISMSCGARTYPYNDPWDSSAVGWIIALKETILKEAGCEYVLDENGNRIKEVHSHGDSRSTWSYKVRPLTEETWRRRAVEIMESSVETYDQYLTGDVYGFRFFELTGKDGDVIDESDIVEKDSCWGFYGSDVMENGISDHVGCGLAEAILAGTVEVGSVKKRTYTINETKFVF